MEHFTLQTKVCIGLQALEELITEDIKKACLICDPFMVESGKINIITDILDKKNCHYEFYSDIIPDPTLDVVISGIQKLHLHQPDIIISVGGGSAIDTAKSIRYLYSKITGSHDLGLIAVPTTSGTGSEVTSFAVVTDSQAAIKYPLRDEAMVPDFALLVPELVASVPPKITADTGMDVLTHALEAYVSIKATDCSDAFSEKACRLVWQYLYEAYAHGDNMKARKHMHNASCMAGTAFNNASLGLCHGMAHAFGARFHISHGRCNAVLLPIVIAYNAALESRSESEAGHKYAELANSLGIEGATDKITVTRFVREIEKMMDKMSIPHGIKGLGIDRTDFEVALDEMAENAMNDLCTETNPRKPLKEEIIELYKKLID